MWQRKTGNKSYEQYLSFQSHKGHVERMLLSKPTIDNKSPKQFSFLHNSSIRRCIFNEQNRKIISDNSNLFGKMIELEHKGSPYSTNILHPLFSFPSDKSRFIDTNKSKQNIITDDNSKLYNRLRSAKPAYSAKKYIINRCLSNYNTNNNCFNPYMNYAPLASFKRNLSIHIQKEYGEFYKENNDHVRNKTSQGFYSPHYSQMVKIHRKSMKLNKQQQKRINNSHIQSSQSESYFILR